MLEFSLFRGGGGGEEEEEGEGEEGNAVASSIDITSDQKGPKNSIIAISKIKRYDIDIDIYFVWLVGWMVYSTQFIRSSLPIRKRGFQ